MCGFFSVIRKKGSFSISELNDIRSCGDLIAHRGMDDAGSYLEKNISLIFRRLSIQDTTSEGRQPFISDCGRYVLVFNGEIYNFKELRSCLSAKNKDFRSTSDTEVLIKLLIQYGKDAVHKLRGMFSFVFWDKVEKLLIVSRDRFGIKPLYFHETDEYLAFTSEIKCLLKFNRSLCVENYNASYWFLKRGFLDESENTFYREINAFPKATLWLIQNGKKYEEKYWSLDECVSNNTFNRDRFFDQLSENIKLHASSCLPLSAALSGGIDSTSVVSLLKSNGVINSNFRSYTTITPGAFDESATVDLFVQQFNIKHSYVRTDLTSLEAISLVDEILVAHDEPIQQASTIDHYLLRQQVAADGFKVLLVGEGADELLAGYRRMVYPYLLSLMESKNYGLYKKSLQGAVQLLNISVDALQKNLKIFKDQVASGFGGRENTTSDAFFADAAQRYCSENDDSMFLGLKSDNLGLSFKALLVNHLNRRNVPYVLRMEDRNSMHWGIESRVPFLDHVIVENVLSHKVEEFMLCGENKSMLRRAMNNSLPRFILDKKTKINRPGSNAYFVYDLLRDGIFNALKSFKSGFFNQDGRHLLRHYEHDLANRNLARADFWFRLYVYIRWQSLFIKQEMWAVVKSI